MTRRVDCIRSSAIRRIFEKAAGMPDVVNLSIGQPDFAVPAQVKDAMVDAIHQDKTGYTPSAGLPGLRRWAAGKEGKEDAIITPGATAAIFLTYSVLLEESDELIIFDPYFVVYPDLCRFLGITPVVANTKEDYSIDCTALRNSITPRTKAILVNTPNNPSGHVISEDEKRSLLQIAEEHDLWIISDEVYEKFDYEGQFVSFRDYPRSIVINGFSKSLAMTGLRVGYAAGPSSMINAMVKLQQYSFVCAPSIAQHAVSDCDISKEVLGLKRKRDMLYDGLKDSYNIVKPEGAFYMYIKLEGISGTRFSEMCLDNGLLVVPGGAFSRKDDHVRLSFAADEEDIRKGIGILTSDKLPIP